jgi:ABC-type sugar transport system ATPase subunit
MATITLTDIRKSYGKTEVIHGVSIEVADGEFVVIVGPSGCGKSTLLRMVAGLEAITSGEVEIGGRVVNGLEPRERDIAMVFQNYALYPHMTVFDNMAYGLKIAGVPPIAAGSSSPAWASPKSATRATPDESTSTLSGLKSRCTNPAAWAAASPRPAPAKSSTISRGSRRRSVMGALPLDLSIREYADSGKPSVVSDPDGRIAEIYRRIARRVAVKIGELQKDMTGKFPNIVIQNT